MNRKSISLLVGLSLLGFITQPVLGAYSAIDHDHLDGTPDTNFVGGVLTIQQADANDLELFDSMIPTTYYIDNATVDLNTTMVNYDPTPVEPDYPNGRALFAGGSFSLTFDYSEVSATGPWTSYEISGPISGLYAGITQVYVGYYAVIKGEGLWTAATKNLPGSGYWPDDDPEDEGFSSIHSLTVQIPEIAEDWPWNEDLYGGDTKYVLTPDKTASPEPTALLLLAIGAAGLLRRRR